MSKLVQEIIHIFGYMDGLVIIRNETFKKNGYTRTLYAFPEKLYNACQFS